MTNVCRKLLPALFLAFMAGVAPVMAQNAPKGPTADDLFYPHVLHEVRLELHSTDWQKLQQNYLSNTYYPTALLWNGLTVRNVGIRSRGLGSRRPVKPGLRVDFNRYSPGNEFLGLKSLILDNVIQDPSMMKEALTMRFFQRMGLPAPRESFARLFVNNNYVGLYVIVESVDKSFLRRNFGEVNGDFEDDGFLYEYKWKSDYRFGYLGSSLEPYAEMFQPVTHEKDTPEPLYRPLEELVRLVNQAPDDQFVAAVGERFDLPAFMTHVAIETFLSELDGVLGNWGMNNFYYYRFELSRSSRLIPWDKDNTFWAVDQSIWQGADENALMRRAARTPELRSVYLATLLRAADLAGAIDMDLPAPADPAVPRPGFLERDITRMYHLIREAAYADPNKEFVNERFEDEVGKMLHFARQRGNVVRGQVASELPQ